MRGFDQRINRTFNGEEFTNPIVAELEEEKALVKECVPLNANKEKIDTLKGVFFLSVPDTPQLEDVAEALAQHLNLEFNPFLYAGTYADLSDVFASPKYIRISERAYSLADDNDIVSVLEETKEKLGFKAVDDVVAVKPLVYLVSRDFSALGENEKELEEKKKRFVADCYSFPLVPINNEGESDEKTVLANYQMIEASDFVMANLNPLNADEPDSQTCLEVGYALAKGKPVIGYAKNAHPKVQRLRLVQSTPASALSNMLLYHPSFYFVEGGFSEAMSKAIGIYNKEEKSI